MGAVIAGPHGLHAAEMLPLVRKLRRVALALTGDDASADDLVQDTLVVWLRDRDRHERDRERWLAGVLRNLHRMHRRGGRRRQRREGDPVLAGAVHGQADLARALPALQRALAILDEELETLREPFRATIRWRHVEGQTCEQIALRLGLPSATVRRRLQRGLEMLRARMQARLAEDAHDWRTAFSALVPAFGPRLVPMATPRPWPWLALHGGLHKIHKIQLMAGVVVALALVAPSRERPLAPVPARTGYRQATTPAANAAMAAPTPSAKADGPRSHSPAAARAPGSAAACGSLQARIDAAAPGDTVVVADGCIHREALTIDKPLRLTGGADSEIRGSDEWTAFTPTAFGFVSDDVLPEPVARRVCAHDEECRDGVQVFADDRPLSRVEAPAPASGQFSVRDGHVVLGDDPAARRIEVTVRDHWIAISGNDVTVEGLTLRHSASVQHHAGLIVHAPARGATIKGNRFFHSRHGCVAVTGDEHRVQDNELADCEGAGLVVYPGQGARVEGNRITRSGHPGWRPWRGGGLLVVFAQAHIAGNSLDRNRGAGIFCIHCRDTVIEGNRIHGNLDAGLIHLSADRGRVSGNRIFANGRADGRPGLLLVGTRLLQVENNLIAYQSEGLVLEPFPHRAYLDGVSPCQTSRDNRIEGNQFVWNATPMRWHSSDAAPCPRNDGLGNRAWPRIAQPTGPGAHAFVAAAPADELGPVLSELR